MHSTVIQFRAEDFVASTFILTGFPNSVLGLSKSLIFVNRVFDKFYKDHTKNNPTGNFQRSLQLLALTADRAADRHRSIIKLHQKFSSVEELAEKVKQVSPNYAIIADEAFGIRVLNTYTFINAADKKAHYANFFGGPTQVL